MSYKMLLLSAALGAVVFGGPAVAQSTMDKAKTGLSDTMNEVKEGTVGRSIELSAVPAAAMATAHKEIGTNITEAKQERENGQEAYVLEGRDSANKEHTIHVTADGKVIKKD